MPNYEKFVKERIFPWKDKWNGQENREVTQLVKISTWVERRDGSAMRMWWQKAQKCEVFGFNSAVQILITFLNRLWILQFFAFLHIFGTFLVLLFSDSTEKLCARRSEKWERVKKVQEMHWAWTKLQVRKTFALPSLVERHNNSLAKILHLSTKIVSMGVVLHTLSGWKNHWDGN
jgi:hypothetical protein